MSSLREFLSSPPPLPFSLEKSVVVANTLHRTRAGGGGKTQHRKDKIREKNIKLDENRAKRIEREKNAKTENAAGGGASQAQQSSSMEDAIHPSRRARVPGNRW